MEKQSAISEKRRIERQPLDIDGKTELVALMEHNLRVRAKINWHFWRSGLGQIWSMRLSKTGGIASYFENFSNEHRTKPVLDPDRGMA